MATLTLKHKTADKWIKAKYPDLFKRPMAIGIFNELRDAKPDYITTKSIKRLLYSKVRGIKYQHALLNNKNRYHLDGSIMGYVPRKHKVNAQKILDEWAIKND